MTQPFRLAAGGAIDRSRTLAFTFDGRRYEGHPGDTIASALLANGVRLVGRSFKLHRPRGIFSAGWEEPSALAELRSGARQEPNTRMTVAELHDGLTATSQNRWPSLRWDLLSLNGLAASALAAGFYYKTFMWPASFWERVYEPLIRRAAGLGRASRLPDPDRYESAHAHCDVLVVGAGPAGLAAARQAAATGARVIICEQDFAPIDVGPGITVMPRTCVFGYYDGNTLGAIERVADHLPEPPAGQPRQRYWTIRAGRVVLATGAQERLIAFPGNDRPGVMLAGAAATYVRRFAVAPGERAMLFANNDDAYASLFALQDAGIAIAGAVDPRADSPAMAAARARGIRVHAGSEVCGTIGGATLRGARVRHVGGAVHARVTADLLCLSGGFNPAVQLASQSGTPLVWDAPRATWLPGRPVQPQTSVGAAAGEGIAPVHPLWEVRAGGKSFVDLQDDVTAEDIRLAHREGYIHIEHAKRYTTHMMGTDQGKTSGLVGAAVLAAARGIAVQDAGLPRLRPFAAPVTWGAIAGAHVGEDFAPTRQSPLHAWHARHAATFIEAGPWFRPAFYSDAADTDAWDSILREARAVRRHVGICDVSTLGKIDVQGPDAARFLDLLYTNTISTLKPGRARYGLMLREDGIVFDDGTIARLAEDRFFVTTTTGNAAAVLAHMEFHLQTCWPDLDVQLASVTDQWAAMSVAGPRARDTMAAAVTGLDLANDAFPFTAVGEGIVAGAPVRVFRISFSGERAYEIATPAGYGELVWDAVMQAGEAHAITPYGVEALGLLRIEKGHVAGAELNGQTTAADLGLARMLKKRGDFIGRALATRPGLADPARPRLVGLRPLHRSHRLRAGAHLVEAGSRDSLGHVTSVTRSVELEGWIGLALLAGGEARIGTRMQAAFPLADETVDVEIVSPHFVDPANARPHA
jgi:sarcosine oxidase subunit alpha